MIKLHVKKEDEVVILSGDDRGKRGRVIRVFPKTQRVIVEGINIIKRHTRRSQQNPEGKIIEREASIHASKVMPVAKYDQRAAKRGVAPAAAAEPTA